MIQMLFANPIVFLLVFGALVISISVHEFSHAFAADKLGDPTARYLGRLTLNPLAHLDLWGTLLLVVAGFGWGKPVPFNPIQLKNPKRDAAIISFAGPLSNFLLALILAVFYNLLGGGFSLIGAFLSMTIFYNLILGVFNLIPIHPLDGFKVVAGFLPPDLYMQWMQTQNYGIFILLLLLFTGSVNSLLNPFVSFALKLLHVVIH